MLDVGQRWRRIAGGVALLTLWGGGCGEDEGRELGMDSGAESGTSTMTMTDSSGEDSSSGDDMSEGDGDPDGSGDGDGDTDASGDGDGEGELCGNGVVDEGELCDDGVNDGSYEGCDPGCMSLGPFCGDSFTNGPELCDDGNEETHDGCLPNCQIPSSCREILDFDFASPDGVYIVAPKGPDFPFATNCDMSTDGGGWTGIPLAELCSGNLDTELTAVEAAPVEGIDGMCRPYTQDGDGGHTYYFDVVFPPGFEAFYLGELVAKANALDPHTSEVVPANFAQTSWDVAYLSAMSASGDIGFGSGDDPGPATSYGALLQANISNCITCETPFPGGMTRFEVSSVTTLFRIGWGEIGSQLEGWYPWWSGEVYLR